MSEVSINCAVGRMTEGWVCTVLRLCGNGRNVVGMKRKTRDMHSGDRMGKGQKNVIGGHDSLRFKFGFSPHPTERLTFGRHC